MKLVGVILALLLGGASVGCAEARPPFKALDAMTGQVLIDMDEGTRVCSATRAYGPHSFVLTKHCVADTKFSQIRFQGVLMNVERVLFDRFENAIVIVDRDMGPGWAQIAKVPEIGEHVWVVGNPLGIEQMYRESMVSWMGYVPQLGTTIFFHDCRCWSGDSGAGIFDGEGRLVGVHFGGRVSRWRNLDDAPIEWDYPYAYPLTFTPEQEAEAAK